MTPPASRLRRAGTHRLIPSRYPTVGILDRVADPKDLPAVFELEGWTNDRISAEFGLIHALPRDEWLFGLPMATVVMAAFCHPRPGGGRWSGEDRGAWYAGFAIETAHAEAIHHRTAELVEIGVLETRVEMRDYLADFDAVFHDVRVPRRGFAKLRDPENYRASQALARELLAAGSNGVVYGSVRRRGGTCLACFRPRLVSNVRIGGHFEYRWQGSRDAEVRALG